MINWLPKDTRLIELISAISLILGAAIMSQGGGLPIVMTEISHPVFWKIIFLTMGTVQLLGVIYNCKVQVMRGIICWFSGTFWLWLGLICFKISSDFVLADTTTILLGIACYYAVIINCVSGLHRNRR